MARGEDFRISVVDAFAGLLDLGWHFEAEDRDSAGGTNVLAAHLATDPGRASCRSSMVSASRFHPSCENTDPRSADPDGEIDRDTALTFEEAHRSAVEMLRLHNGIGATELWWFVQYLDSDPAAWTDWTGSVRRARARSTPAVLWSEQHGERLIGSSETDAVEAVRDSGLQARVLRRSETMASDPNLDRITVMVDDDGRVSVGAG